MLRLKNTRARHQGVAKRFLWRSLSRWGSQSKDSALKSYSQLKSLMEISTIVSKVDVTDSIGLEKAKKYVNLREYIKKCKKRWGIKSDDAKNRWKDLLADPTIPRAKDQMGWLTMPALSVFQSETWKSQSQPQPFVSDQFFFQPVSFDFVAQVGGKSGHVSHWNAENIPS